jgi:hypothetical protein
MRIAGLSAVGYVKRKLAPVGTSLLFAIFKRGNEVMPDFRSSRYALSLSMGGSTIAAEKTMRAFRSLLFEVSCALSDFSDNDAVTSRKLLG